MITTTPPRPVVPPRPRRSAAALVLAVLLLLPGLTLLAGGGAALWAHVFERSDGYLTSPQQRLATDGYALVSDRIDLTTGWSSLLPDVGRARLSVTGSGAVFVGIAPADRVREYLSGVAVTHVDGLGFDGGADANDQVAGSAPAAPPADQDFWTAEASGTGRQQVTWVPEDGDWVFVVMNSDGSAGVDVRGRIGAEADSLGWIAWGVLVAGALVTVAAVRLGSRAVRR